MTPPRTEFHVVPTGTEWQIKWNGTEFLAVQSKQVAIEEAVFQAKRNEPSHVSVLGLDGRVEEEVSFGEQPQQQTSAPAGRYRQVG